METTGFSDTSEITYETTRPHNPEDHSPEKYHQYPSSTGPQLSLGILTSEFPIVSTVVSVIFFWLQKINFVENFVFLFAHHAYRAITVTDFYPWTVAVNRKFRSGDNCLLGCCAV
jgi:hypothetical protein